MGNRANVVFVEGEEISPAIYLHWNGGPESIYAFLAELDRRKVRADAQYAAARFTQLVGEFFDSGDHQGGLSLGILPGPTAITLDALEAVRTDTGDNGFYIVDRSDKAPRPMRRFCMRGTGNGYRLHELTSQEVARERRAALKHEYHAAFAATFAKIAGTRTVRE